MTPATLLQALDAIDRRDPAGAELAAGILKYMAEGGTLDDALGLRGIARVQFATAMRHAWLRRAGELVAGVGPWSKAAELAKAIKRFESSLWPRLKRLNYPPRGSELQKCLWLARRGGPPLPFSQDHLARILATEIDSEPISEECAKAMLK